jgi:hypothetical protein
MLTQCSPEHTTCVQIEFGKVRITPPSISESDGKRDRLYPFMARLRKLTYSCSLFVNLSVKRFKITDDGRESLVGTDETERMFLGKGEFCVTAHMHVCMHACMQRQQPSQFLVFWLPNSSRHKLTSRLHSSCHVAFGGV